MNVTAFPKRRPEPTPVATRPRIYAVMGYCEAGFLMGHAIRDVPVDVSEDDAFRGMVQDVFKGVQGLRFGLVLGPRQMAVPTAEPAPVS